MLGFFLCFALLVFCLLMLGDQVKAGDSVANDSGGSSFLVQEKASLLAFSVHRLLFGAKQFLVAFVLSFVRLFQSAGSAKVHVNYFGRATQFIMLVLFGRGILRA